MANLTSLSYGIGSNLDIGHAAVFSLSPAASFISEQVIVVDASSKDVRPVTPPYPESAIDPESVAKMIRGKLRRTFSCSSGRAVRRWKAVKYVSGIHGVAFDILSNLTFLSRKLQPRRKLTDTPTSAAHSQRYLGNYKIAFYGCDSSLKTIYQSVGRQIQTWTRTVVFSEHCGIQPGYVQCLVRLSTRDVSRRLTNGANPTLSSRTTSCQHLR
jgi:hypothetical protein